MDQISLFPLMAAATAVVASVHLAARSPSAKAHWLVPAGFSTVFLGLSLQAGLTEGPLGFWPEHTRNLWGNQIWYDLLLATVAALALLIPQAKAIGMKVLPWVLLTLATGSIGLYAFLSRFFYLKAKEGRARTGPSAP